jgi:hypothetical protein
MAGPTPVSRADPRRDHGHGRRLHDRRLNFLFDLAPDTLHVSR